MSDHRNMNVVELTQSLGRLLQEYGKFEFSPPASMSVIRRKLLERTVAELRAVTRQVAQTKTPFVTVYLLTSLLFNSEDPNHLWRDGVIVIAKPGSEHLAEKFRRESTWVWNRMKILFDENGFLP